MTTESYPPQYPFYRNHKRPVSVSNPDEMVDSGITVDKDTGEGVFPSQLKLPNAYSIPPAASVEDIDSDY